MKKKLLVGLATGLLMLGVGRMATAALTVNVAFGTSSYSGIGAAPDAGTVWNGLSYNGGSNLLNSNGTATGISVGTTASEAFSDGGTSLMDNRIFVTGSWGPFDVTISGLNNSSTYNLYVYGSNPIYASTYTVGSTSDYSLGVENNAPYLYHTNYALLTGLDPTNGEIDIRVDRYLGSEAAVISGFQLVQTTPTSIPDAAWLLGSGLMGLFGLRKREVL